MSIIIKEVLTKKDLKKWVDFPNKLYKDVKPYVPFLFSDELSTFTKEQNPAYKFCETKLFLAYKENKIGLAKSAYTAKDRTEKDYVIFGV